MVHLAILHQFKQEAFSVDFLSSILLPIQKEKHWLAVRILFIYLQMLETPEEKSKFEQIYLEYRDLVFYIANRILHNKQDSEDVVHEAFLKSSKLLVKLIIRSVPKRRT